MIDTNELSRDAGTDPYHQSEVSQSAKVEKPTVNGLILDRMAGMELEISELDKSVYALYIKLSQTITAANITIQILIGLAIACLFASVATLVVVSFFFGAMR